MRNRRRHFFATALACSMAAMAIAASPTAFAGGKIKATPEAIGKEANDLLERLHKLGMIVVSVSEKEAGCACGGTVKPNVPRPPPVPINREAIQRAIKLLQALEKGYATNQPITIHNVSTH